MDCRAVIRVLWDYIDGELPLDEVEAVRSHLALCKRCYPQYAFEIAFLEKLAELQTSVPSPSDALRTRVLELVGDVSAS